MKGRQVQWLLIKRDDADARDAEADDLVENAMPAPRAAARQAKKAAKKAARSTPRKADARWHARALKLESDSAARLKTMGVKVVD